MEGEAGVHVQWPADLEPVAAVAAGGFHTCGLQEDGRLSALAMINMASARCQQILGPWLLWPLDTGTPAPCKQMGCASAMTFMGSARCLQIWGWGLLWQLVCSTPAQRKQKGAW